MKKTIIIFSLFVIIAAFLGCKEESVGQTPVDGTPPGMISGAQVQNIPGGAIITYQIPDDEDLCFIRAEYMRQGKLCTDHSSVYKNSLTVEGFGTTEPVEVNIYAVDFSMNKSQPVKVTIQPEPPYIHDIFRTIKPIQDFAGVNLQWKNDNKQAISVTLLYKDDDKFIEKETHFSDLEEGEYIFRTFESVPTDFKVFIKDKWENSSDTLDFDLTPLYEVALDRTLYKEMRLPFDNTSVQHGGVWWALWDNCHDGDTFDLGWVTELNNNPENDHRFPIMTTFDLGTTAQLSRTKMWMRGLLEYGTGAFRKVEFWGSETMDTNKPRDYWASDERGSWKNDWIHLGDFETTKPSGPSGAATEDDKIWARNGFEFKFNIAPKVRYVRLLVNSTWSSAKNLELCEIAYWGNDKDELDSNGE